MTGQIVEHGDTRLGKIGSDFHVTRDNKETIFLPADAAKIRILFLNRQVKGLSTVDRLTMTRHQCQSSLVFEILLEDRVLELSMKHKHPPSYRNKALSP